MNTLRDSGSSRRPKFMGTQVAKRSSVSMVEPSVRPQRFPGLPFEMGKGTSPSATSRGGPKLEHAPFLKNFDKGAPATKPEKKFRRMKREAALPKDL